MSAEPSLIRTVLQSVAIHPEWWIDDHIHFLQHDEFGWWSEPEAEPAMTTIVRATLALVARTDSLTQRDVDGLRTAEFEARLAVAS